MVERLTPVCFLKIHDAGIRSTVSRPPVTDFLSALAAAKSASLYAMTFSGSSKAP
ncbi:hypothetical protein PF003_g18275 [Phytophthora fragariae]|nr:hypothetical protein PF003_g18275 [Phytophthora fragariae]